MGLDIWGACAAGAGLGDGVLAGEAGARYLTMAGSTSGVPWKTKVPVKHGYRNVMNLNARVCSRSLSVACVWETGRPGPPSGTRRLSV